MPTNRPLPARSKAGACIEASADWTPPERTKSAPSGQSGTPHFAIREYPFDEYAIQLRGVPRKGYSLSTRIEHFPEGMGSVLLRAPKRSIVK